MNLNEAINIIEQEAEEQGLLFLEFLMEVDKNGVQEYCELTGLNDDFRQAYRMVMQAGREMFS